jgi:hypothetical protein
MVVAAVPKMKAPATTTEKDHPGKVWQDRTLCLSSMRREVESGNHVFATK